MAVNTGMTSGNDFVESIEDMISISSRIEMEPRSVLIAVGIEK